MGMKELADEVISEVVADRSTYDEVRMGVLACRINDLESMLRKKLDLIKCGIAANYSGDPYENKLYIEAKEMIEDV